MIILISSLKDKGVFLFELPLIYLFIYIDDSPPGVTISVKEHVVIDEDVTLICHINPLTKDTRIMWSMQNETFLRAINNNDKYKIIASESQKLSNLTISSVRHEDEMNYTCQATNFIQTGKSNPMHLSVFECKTLFIYSQSKYGVPVMNTISLFI